MSIRTYWHPHTQRSGHPKSDSAGRGCESRITFRNPFPILFHRPADSKHYNWLFLTGFPTISKTFPYSNTPIYICLFGHHPKDGEGPLPPSLQHFSWALLAIFLGRTFCNRLFLNLDIAENPPLGEFLLATSGHLSKGLSHWIWVQAPTIF